MKNSQECRDFMQKDYLNVPLNFISVLLCQTVRKDSTILLKLIHDRPSNMLSFRQLSKEPTCHKVLCQGTGRTENVY